MNINHVTIPKYFVFIHERYNYKDPDNKTFEKFDETVRIAPSAEDLMKASTGQMNILQAASNYGLDKYVRCLLEYPGKVAGYANEINRE